MTAADTYVDISNFTADKPGSPSSLTTTTEFSNPARPKTVEGSRNVTSN